MSDEIYIYNKEEVIEALKRAVNVPRREELIELVSNAKCEAFRYGSADISKMEISLSGTRRADQPRDLVCGDVVSKILEALGEPNPPNFTSSISIETMAERKEGGLSHQKKL